MTLSRRVAALEGVPAALPPDPDLLTRRTRELVADLAEPAKSSALPKLVRTGRRLGIASAWLRNKFGMAATPETQTTTLQP
jgi:hypothetical protein